MLWSKSDAILKWVIQRMFNLVNVTSSSAFQARWFYCSKLDCLTYCYLSCHIESKSMHFFYTGFEWSGSFRVQWHFMPVILHACISFSCGEVAKALNRERTLCSLPDDVLSALTHTSLPSVNPCRPINSSLKSLPPWSFRLKYSTYLSRNSNIQSHSGLQEFFPGCKNHNLLKKTQISAYFFNSKQ